MADHYFSIPPGYIGRCDPNVVTVGTSSAGGSKFEVRITDATIRKIDAVNALEFLADLIRTGQARTHPTGCFKD